MSRSDPISDDDLSKVTVGELTPHNATVTLMEYDPAWAALFRREEARIRHMLGAEAVLVEHAGSTSVPGLPAKPVIDIVLAVTDSADEPRYVPALEAAGYRMTIREPDWFQHRLFKGPDTNINLHVFTSGCTEIDRMLLFRDWLRSHEDDRARYAATKRDLASRVWRHVQHYAEAKGDVVRDIMTRAETAGGQA